MMRFLVTRSSRVIALAAAFARGIAPAPPTSAVAPLRGEASPNVGAIRLGTGAREQLHQLWSASIDAKEERVACVGGARREGVIFVTRVEPLRSEGADSSNIPAATSLHECRPPEWFGTVHTHILSFQGQPYATFSASDRDVIGLWHRRWQVDGVFCVLFTEAQAHCEAGTDTSEDVAYADVPAVSVRRQRGNVIGGTH